MCFKLALFPSEEQEGIVVLDGGAGRRRVGCGDIDAVHDRLRYGRSGNWGGGAPSWILGTAASFG